MSPTLFLLLLVSVATAQDPCGNICRFKLCSVLNNAPREDNSMVMGPEGFVRSGPLICQTNVKDLMGFVVKSGEPIVERPEGDVRLKKWRPAGLSHAFKRKFFFPGDVEEYGKSGIGRGKTVGNQWDMLDGECVRLPVLAYEKLKKRSREVKKVVRVSRKDPANCVAFRAKASLVLIEIEWVGRDDLDLRVIEPDGTRLDRNNRDSEHGSFFEDVSESCFSDKKTGREGVIYAMDKMPQAGVYRIEGRHYGNCGNGPTDWKLRVTVGGELILREEGTSDLKFSALFLETSFELTGVPQPVDPTPFM